MAQYLTEGTTHIEVDDAGGTVRDLSAYVEEIEPLGEGVEYLDVTGLSDAAQRVVAGPRVSQEFLLRGLFDDTADTGPDAVLSGIVGLIGTVSYGPAGGASGRRRITGQFLCLSYRVIARLGNQVRFESRFKQDGPVTLDSWD